MGWPRHSSPPLGLTGSFPPSVVAPDSAKGPPSPIGAEAQLLGLLQLAEGGGVVDLDHVDVLRTQAGHLIGVSGARSPMPSRPLSGREPDFRIEARIFTGRASGYFFSAASEQIKAAAAPSPMGAHMERVRG